MDNYNLIDKILHKIFIGNMFMKKTLFEIEKLIYLKYNKKNNIFKKHIFIAGMPRSGTTAILNYLNKTNFFKSLTYRNMPYIMAPNLLGKLINNKKIISKVERPHQDGVFHDLDAPEALDEIFLSTFEKKEIIKEFPNFINVFLLNSNKRYLSKNNKNYQRIAEISSIFPNCIFLILFRDPIHQSLSLLAQHQNFVNHQKSNPYFEEYMNLLGHNEFGNSHKPWNKPDKFHDTNNINYWLEQWMFFYKKIYSENKENPNCLFIKYEGLENPDYLKYILEEIEICASNKFHFRKNKKKTNTNIDNNLLKNCLSVYKTLEIQIPNKFR